MDKAPDSSAAFAAAIDEQVKHLLQTRAMFPTISADMVGATQASTASYYQAMGFQIEFKFSPSLTSEAIERTNAIGHWINQNFCVRLYSTMESYQMVSETIKIRAELEGADELDILRRLRNEFAHGSGWHDPHDGEHRKLRERIIQHFGVRDADLPEATNLFPIPIDRVLVPMGAKCKAYGVAFLK